MLFIKFGGAIINATQGFFRKSTSDHTNKLRISFVIPGMPDFWKIEEIFNTEEGRDQRFKEIEDMLIPKPLPKD